MGVSKEDPCDVVSSTSQARREVPPLSNGASSSFYLSPGSMCEQGIDDYESQSRRHLTHADPTPQSIEVSISLFENNMYAPASVNQIGTPVTSVKLRSSGAELIVRNFSDAMEVRVGVAPGVLPARGLPVAWECSPPPGYPPYPPSLPQPPASPPALPHPPSCFNIPLPPEWGALSCSNFGDLGPNSFYCTYADVQASCCGCGAGGSSMAPPPPSPFTPPPVNDSTCRPVYGAGDCSDLSYCSGRGTCVDGVCTCSSGFVGAKCTVRLSCNYWNGETWSSDGITSTLEEGTLVCATTCATCRPRTMPTTLRTYLCSAILPSMPHLTCHLPFLSRRHLTKFGGFLSIPTSVDELLQELKSEFKINDIAFDVLSNFNAADNPTIMNVIILLIFMDTFTVVFLGKYRGYRARVNRRREHRMLKDEQTAARMRARGV